MILEYYNNKTINNSTLFFMPLIGSLLGLDCSNKSFLKFCYDRGFANCYLNEEDSNNRIYMYFNTQHSEYEGYAVDSKGTLLTIHEYIIKRSACIDYYEDGLYMVYIIDMDPIKDDFKLIINGRYSEISEFCKTLYTKNLKVKSPDYHLIYSHMVINKQDSLNQLFFDSFGFSYETDYHDLFSEEQDYCSGNIKEIDFFKSNNLFKEIVSSLKTNKIIKK